MISSYDLLKAVILGLVEGMTEFLPVSSTGHLILVGEALKFSGEKAKAFEVFIQLGAILSVVVLYRERFFSLFKGIFPLRQWLSISTYKTASGGLDGSSGILNVAVTCIPAVIAGGLLHKKIEALFYPPYVAAALIVGGIAFLIVENTCPKPKISALSGISLKLGFLIGCFQSLALWPGVSRSGATLVGAMLLGVERTVAADFSFIVAVPLITAAALMNFVKVISILSTEDLEIFTIGLVVSFAAGIASISIFIQILKRFSLRPFAYYRIALGTIVLLVAYFYGMNGS